MKQVTLNFRQIGDPINLVLISNLYVINFNKIMPVPPKSLQVDVIKQANKLIDIQNQIGFGLKLCHIAFCNHGI